MTDPRIGARRSAALGDVSGGIDFDSIFIADAVQRTDGILEGARGKLPPFDLQAMIARFESLAIERAALEEILERCDLLGGRASTFYFWEEEEVFDQAAPARRTDRFGVKLHAINREFPVAQPHDNPVLRARRHLEALG